MRSVLAPNEMNHSLLVSDEKGLSPEEEVELAKRIENGDIDARDQLICANLGLVKYIVKGYECCDVLVDDLIQAGNVGLIKAAERFDYRKACRFSTYARYWIIKEILEEFSKSFNLGFTKVPKRLKEDVNSTYVELCHKFLREPTRAEIAETLRLTFAQVEEGLTSNTATVSLDSPIRDGESEITYEDSIADSSVNVEHDLINQELRRQLQEAILILPERERKIIRLKLEGVKGTDIAKRLGISSPRVTQLFQSALENLKVHLSNFN